MRNDLKDKYKESLKYTPEPVLLSQLPEKVDIQRIMDYAKSKNTKVSELSDEEKQRFIHP